MPSKVKESTENPNILDYLQNQKIDLVINTPMANKKRNYSEILNDGYIIRRQAQVEFNVPVVANLELASALVRVLKKRDQNGNSLCSLNDYMNELPWNLW